MELIFKVRLSIVKSYVLIFFFMTIYRLLTHQFLFQLDPPFFYNKLDFSSWLIMLSGLHKLLLNNKAACLVFDLLFYLIPYIYYFTLKTKPQYSVILAVTFFLISIIYSIIFCLYPSNSIESFIAIILFPATCIATSDTSFWYTFQSYRYYFLYFFASAGIWKIVQGGLFNLDEMSAILLNQHKELFASNQSAFLPTIYKWLILHPKISYLLYAAGTILELTFIVGFFTKKLDKLLLFLYILFLVMDIFVMQINYSMTMPFIITLIYSRYKPEVINLFQVNKIILRSM